MIWTAGTILDHTQELLGEPVGGFYNIPARLAQLNAHHRELVEETRALSAQSTFTLDTNEPNLTVPYDFLTFDPQAPYLMDGSDFKGTLKVVPMSYLDEKHPGWQDSTNTTGVPMFLVLRGDLLTLYPTPDSAYALTIPYVPFPEPMESRADLPFNGIERLNRHAIALSYQLASTYLLSRNLSAANMMREFYDKELRAMRSSVRSSPQHQPSIRYRR